MVNLVVTTIVKNGKMDAFLAECARVRPLVLAENGCHAYEFSRDIQSPLPIQEPVNPERVTLVEKWETMEALKAHLETPHMKAFGPKVKDLRESVSARVLEPVF